MHKKFAKAASASFMAAAMLTSTVAATAPSVFAGYCTGESTFDEKGLPWHTCETSPAQQKFDLDLNAGVYRTTIINPGGSSRGGDSRWDLQFRHRKLKIQKGHTYKIHWEVTASQSGEMAAQIATLDGSTNVAWHNNGGNNFGGSWDNVKISAGKNVFDDEFTADVDIPVAEWAFHYGGAGEHQPQDCFPVGTVLEFDNMSLECVDCGDTYKDGSCLWDPSDDYGIKNRRNSGLENNFISVNQVGYFTKLAKKATLGDNAGGSKADIKAELGNSPMEFKLVSSNGEVVKTGMTSVKGQDADSGDFCHILDFSDYTTPGKYHLECGEYKSFEFEIGDDIYSKADHNMLTNAMNYYYQNRSGIDIETKYITSGNKAELAHEAGHVTDMAYVQPIWQNEYAGEFDGDTSYQIDCKGGWYDAGDHGKYVVNGGVSVWTLQNIYERSLKLGTADKFADNSGAVVIPESGDGKKVPDILDETRYELDWMMKMIVQPGDKIWGDYAGLVYHKMHDHKWTGLATRPYDYQKEWGTTRIVKPPSLAATANFAACAAQASRLWEPYDSAYAAKLLKAAEDCYDAFNKYYYAYGTKSGENADSNSNKTSLYAPGDQAKGGGPYGDDEVSDDAYWAACELYATTGNEKYYNDMLNGNGNGSNKWKYDNAMEVVETLNGGENSSSFSSFNWGCTGSLGSLTLWLNKDSIGGTGKLADSDVTKLKDSLTKAADAYVAKEEEQAYGIPYRGSTFTDPNNIGRDDNGKLIEVTGYEWGSNSFVINNAIVMAYAYDMTDNTKYLNGVSTAMDYLLGRNPLSFSYVTGYGSYCLSSPHHRYWSKELDPDFPAAPDGVLSGGPGSGMQDPYVAGLGYKAGQLSPERCYVDSCEAWSVNEVTINWNAPLVWVSSFLQDEASDSSITPPTPTEGSSNSTQGSSEGSSQASSEGSSQGSSQNPSKPTPSDNPDGPTANTDPSKVADAKWGDVNVDEEVTVSDVVALNKFLLNNVEYPVQEQGYVNANCVYDEKVNTADSSIIMNYVGNMIKYEKLGPQ